MSDIKTNIVDQFYPDDLIGKIKFILVMTAPDALTTLNIDRKRSIYDIAAISELRKILNEVLHSNEIKIKT